MTVINRSILCIEVGASYPYAYTTPGTVSCAPARRDVDRVLPPLDVLSSVMAHFPEADTLSRCCYSLVGAFRHIYTGNGSVVVIENSCVFLLIRLYYE